MGISNKLYETFLRDWYLERWQSWIGQSSRANDISYLPMKTFELEWAFSGSKWVAFILPFKASAVLGL